MAGSTGVLVPPQGYLERLRAICDKHGILLIFDEVITGFGRLGAPLRRRALRRHARPDDHGQGADQRRRADGRGVRAQVGVYDALMPGPENAIELFHGYTYSGHPLACAAALATLDIYARGGPVRAGAPAWALFGRRGARVSKGVPHVIDLRNIGLVGAASSWRRAPARPGARAYDVFLKCLRNGVLMRQTGDMIALSPPLIASRRPRSTAWRQRSRPRSAQLRTEKTVYFVSVRCSHAG